MTSAREWHVVAFGRTASQVWFEDESDMSAVAWPRAIRKIESWAPARWGDDRTCRPQRLRSPSAACVRLGAGIPLARGVSEDSCGAPANPLEHRLERQAPNQDSVSLPASGCERYGLAARPLVQESCLDSGVEMSARRAARSVTRNADSLACMARAWARRAHSARLSHAITRSSRCTNADSTAVGCNGVSSQTTQDQLELATIAETMSDVVLSNGLDGTIHGWSASAERLFGYRAEEIVGESLRVLAASARVQ